MATEDKKIRKAVIAAAGFGTRFLPQTKAMPKEMLPLVDKPIIQHIVEELVDAGIEDIVIVTGYHKRSIEDHFDYMSADLRANLKQSGKTELLEQVKKISELANFAYVRQKGTYGTGAPLLNVSHLIGDEPFIYTFADDFIEASPSRFKQMIDMHLKYRGSVIAALERDGDEDYSRYGYVKGNELESGLIDVTNIVEKPGKRENSPSSLASVSGYLLEPVVFNYLDKQLENYTGEDEFKLQDAMQSMIDDGRHIYACKIQDGQYYDTGNKLEYLKTVVDFALKHEELKDDFLDFLRGRIT